MTCLPTRSTAPAARKRFKRCLTWSWSSCLLFLALCDFGCVHIVLFAVSALCCSGCQFFVEKFELKSSLLPIRCLYSSSAQSLSYTSCLLFPKKTRRCLAYKSRLDDHRAARQAQHDQHQTSSEHLTPPTVATLILSVSAPEPCTHPTSTFERLRAACMHMPIVGAQQFDWSQAATVYRNRSISMRQPVPVTLA